MRLSILRLLRGTAIAFGALLGILVLGLLFVPPATRWYTDSWGATPEEVAAVLPGDDVVPAEREISTKAVTIAAPPEVVYALIQQMGQHRAGWYGWDWFYHATKSSDFIDGHYSTRIVPELQDVAVGDEIWINDAVAYEVVELVPNESFVMYTGSVSHEELASTPLPETWSANTMAWVLTPTSDGGTRLVVRLRADGTDTGFTRWLWNGPLNFGGALFSHKTMMGIKRTAEALED